MGGDVVNYTIQAGVVKGAFLAMKIFKMGP